MRLAIILLFTALAYGAEAAGQWKLSYTTENGHRREATLDLKVYGGAVTGTLSSERGSARIEEGGISGDEIWFKLVRKGSGDEITVIYKGKIEAGKMKLQMQMGGRTPVEVLGVRGL